MDKDLDFSLVPHGWALCYVEECGRKEECMRYLMCLQAPKDQTRFPCVLPTVLTQAECPHFHSAKKQRMAVGFRKMFDELKPKYHRTVRARLMAYLGYGGTYYRYRNGERTLTPAQQEWIVKLLRRYGCTEETIFDGYREEYRFNF